MIKKIAFFIFVSVIMVASFGVASKFIVAQDKSPSELAAQDAKTNIKGLNLFTEEELLEKAFPNNKQTCVTKASLFMAIGKAYEKGEGIEEMVPMNLLKPVLEGYYTDIKNKGVENAYLKNILDYQSCIKGSEPHEDAEKEKVLATKHRACLKFSDAVLYTLDGIKSRKSVDTIMSRYENSAPDMSDTAFSGVDHPIIFFIGQIYKTAKTKSYDDAVQMGHSLVVACGA